MFRRFDIPIGDMNRTAQETIYADFKTGRLAADYVPSPFPDVSQALQNYLAVCEKYEHMLLPNYHEFPEPEDIPDDLLMPFGEFAKKYDFEPALHQIFEVTGMGVGDMLHTPTMHVMQTFGAPLARVFVTGPNVFQPVSRNNSELYGKIAELLGDDVLYMSTAVDSERTESGVKLVVEGYDGSKTLVKAKKLLLAIEPTLDNVAPFDMDEQELDVFSKWIHTREYVGVVQHPSLPFNTSIVNIPDSARGMDLTALPTFPFQPRFDHLPGSADLFSVIVVMSADSTSEDAMRLVEDHLKNMITADTLPTAGSTEESMYPTIVAWGDHGPMHVHASNEEMKKGFIQRQYALQGGRSTYFTGAAWVGHFTTVVWEFNEAILPQLLREDKKHGKEHGKDKKKGKHANHGNDKKHKGHGRQRGHGRHGRHGRHGGQRDHGEHRDKPFWGSKIP